MLTKSLAKRKKKRIVFFSLIYLLQKYVFYNYRNDELCFFIPLYFPASQNQKLGQYTKAK